MGRSTGLALLGVSLFLLALSVALGKPGLPQGLKADEAAYLLMAQSLARDGDVRLEERDMDRLFEEFHYRPTRNLVLASDDGWQTVYFGKPFVYSLVAAPFVRVLGSKGMVLLNMLLLVAMIWLGSLYLSRFNPEPIAALFATGFFLISAGFSYVFWLQPEIFTMACVTAALYLGLARDSRSARLSRPQLAGTGREQEPPTPAAIAAAGALLALAVYHKPPVAALILPLVGLPLLRSSPWRERLRLPLACGLGFAATVGILALVSLALIGHPTSYLGMQRQGFWACAPGVLPVQPAATIESGDPAGDAAGDRASGLTPTSDEGDRDTGAAARAAAEASPTGNDLSWLVRIPEVHVGKLVENVGYFLWGRHTGLLLYFPFAGLSIGLFLLASRRSAQGWMLLAALVLVGGFYLLNLAWNWHGGGGFVGNRYFVSAVPGFLFLVEAVAPAWLPAVGYALGGLFIGPLLFTPFGAMVPEGTLQAHTRSFPLRAFPLELSLRNLPGYHRLGLGPLRLVAREDRVVPEDETLWVEGATRTEILVLAAERLGRQRLQLLGVADGEVEVALGGDRVRVPLRVGEIATVELEPRSFTRRYSPANDLWWVTELEVETSGGAIRHRTRHWPATPCSGTWAYDPVTEESFFAGAGVRILGSPEIVDRDLYAVSWAPLVVPDRVAAGSELEVVATAINRSGETWPAAGATRVRAAYRLVDRASGEAVSAFGPRIDLEAPVPPGEASTMTFVVTVPRAPGEYRLELDLVYEYVAWFSDRGSPVASAPLTVVGEPPGAAGLAAAREGAAAGGASP
ncbi:MAG TPA: hypothetical protein VMT85_12765 [Thermoanaerobaculia bacterium]|nr:hypothetical protein [Thermoanaerobaculia bacterium]